MAAAAAAKKKRAGDSMTGIPVQLPYPLHMTTDAHALLPPAQTAFAVRFALLLLSNNPSYFFGCHYIIYKDQAILFWQLFIAALF
jgi:hypothetical protein